MCLSSKHGYGSDSLHTLKSSLTTGYQSTAQALLAKKSVFQLAVQCEGTEQWWTEADLPCPR